MNARKSALIIAVFVAFSASAQAADVMPAWQAPNYIMEEVVVTAQAPADGQGLAWEAPGFVMEEVVVTARAPIDGQGLAWEAPGYVMEEVVVTAPAIMVEFLAIHEETIAKKLSTLF